MVGTRQQTGVFKYLCRSMTKPSALADHSLVLPPFPSSHTCHLEIIDNPYPWQNKEQISTPELLENSYLIPTSFYLSSTQPPHTRSFQCMHLTLQLLHARHDAAPPSSRLVIFGSALLTLTHIKPYKNLILASYPGSRPLTTRPQTVQLLFFRLRLLLVSACCFMYPEQRTTPLPPRRSP